MKLDNHFKISIVKSWIRIAAGMMIINFGIDNSFSILAWAGLLLICLLYTSPSPRDGLLSRMPSSA